MRYPPPELLETRKRAVARYLDGTGTGELAELYNVTPETIRRWCRLANVKTPRPNPILTAEEVERARALINEGASRSEAARTIGRSPQALTARGLAGWAAEQISEHVSMIKSSAYSNLGLRVNEC